MKSSGHRLSRKTPGRSSSKREPIWRSVEPSRSSSRLMFGSCKSRSTKRDACCKRSTSCWSASNGSDERRLSCNERMLAEAACRNEIARPPGRLSLRVRSAYRVRYGVAARAFKYEFINPRMISWLDSGKIHADFAADAVGNRDVLIRGMRVRLLRHPALLLPYRRERNRSLSHRRPMILGR